MKKTARLLSVTYMIQLCGINVTEESETQQSQWHRGVWLSGLKDKHLQNCFANNSWGPNEFDQEKKNRGNNCVKLHLFKLEKKTFEKWKNIFFYSAVLLQL